MTVLYFDCFSGASGDMIVGALIDAGVPLDEIRAALGSLSIDRDAVWTERVQRAGISATKFQVRGEDIGGAHHHHSHGGVATEAHAHRTLTEIDALIDDVIAANPDQLASYRSGKEALLGFFVGQVIKASKGKANPKVVNERLRAKLNG